MVLDLQQRHLVHRLRHVIQSRGENTALYSESLRMSWKELGIRLDELAYVLLDAGIAEQERVAIFSPNMPEWTQVDLALLSIRAIPVPIYATNTQAQAEYIICDGDIRLIFVGEQAQYDKAWDLLNGDSPLQQVVVFNPEVIRHDDSRVSLFSDFLARADPSWQALLNKRIDAARLDDIITLIYTSGTTGEPKGVVLDYANMDAAIRIHRDRVPLSTHDISLCFLPLSHVFERAWIWNVLSYGAAVAYCLDTNKVQADLRRFRPTVMCAVPRFFEKVYGAIQAKAEKSSRFRRELLRWSEKTGRNFFRASQGGGRAAWPLRLQYWIADRLVFRKIRRLMGGRIRFFPCGGARLDDHINEFFHGIGLPILLGYGMTETTSTVSVLQPGRIEIGTVGQLLPELEVRIGQYNEIEVRGPTVMRGYFNKPEATAAVLENGWFKTGDAGEFDAVSGTLTMTERLKDLMKTSGGKYIAPQVIEGLVGQDLYIDQVAVIANERKFVSALIVPDFKLLEQYAHDMGLNYQQPQELVEHAVILMFFNERLKTLQKSLAHFEQIKRFTLLPSKLSIEKGEITPTMKLRRTVIEKHYAEQIESMYT